MLEYTRHSQLRSGFEKEIEAKEELTDWEAKNWTSLIVFLHVQIDERDIGDNDSTNDIR